MHAGLLMSSTVKQASFQRAAPTATGATGVAGVSDEDEALNKVIAESLCERPTAASTRDIVSLADEDQAGPSTGTKALASAPITDVQIQQDIDKAMQKSLQQQVPVDYGASELVSGEDRAAQPASPSGVACQACMEL